MVTVNDLLENANDVSAKDFGKLIKSIITLLKSENGHLGSMLVTGKLIELISKGQVIVIGDLHGDLDNLTKILADTNFLEEAQTNKQIFLIFLGDYGDRGIESPEVYYIILKLKEIFPKKVILMRGNHEGPPDMLPYPHDLPLLLQKRFPKSSLQIYKLFQKLFDQLYNAVLINNNLILIHGGFPNGISKKQDLANADELHPKEKYLEEMLWSDPTEEFDDLDFSSRGAGKLFGKNLSRKMMKILKVKVLIRSHESCPKGYKINHEGRILTIFSTNKSPYKNKCAAYLNLNINCKIMNANELKSNLRFIYNKEQHQKVIKP